MERRLTYLVANWKLHMDGKETSAFIKALLEKLPKGKSEIWIAPSYTSISVAAALAQGKVVIGAQNGSEYEEGAYTGEVSAKMLKSVGAAFVLAGHSERRALFGETDPIVNRKVKKILQAGLTPLLCIGENEKEREGGASEAVLERQLKMGLLGLSKEEVGEVLIAYEPIWAIGTGRAATHEIATNAHLVCRKCIQREWGEKMAKRIPILYGGSVKAENIASFLSSNEIDGALIGGASLSVDSFIQIIQQAEEVIH